MTLQEFKALLLTIDNKTTHNKGPGFGNYTVWSEYQERYVFTDDRIDSKQIHIQVDRYTKLEYDPMADAITNGLDTEGVFIYDKRTLYEADSGYIHHVWDVIVDG